MVRGMVEVELVDDEPPGGAPGPDPATEWLRRAAHAVGRGARRAVEVVAPYAVRAWRRPWVRWASLAVVATLVTVPVADASRQRTRLAALAAVPGVVRPLHPGLRALYRLDGEDATLFASGFLVGGAVVSTRQVLGDSAAVGFDAATGRPLWSTPLSTPDTTGATGDAGMPVCSPAGALVGCATKATSGNRRATTASVLDPSDGHVVRSEPLGDHGAVVTAGGLLVVARQTAGPDDAPATGPWTVTWRVTGEDPATGTARWTWTSPPLGVAATDDPDDPGHDPTDYVWQVSAPSGTLRRSDDAVLRVGDDTWVLGPGGTVRAHVARTGGWSVFEARDGTLVRLDADAGGSSSSSSDSSSAGWREQMLLADGTWLPFDGSTLTTLVDDGSAAGVVYLVAGDDARATVSAVDTRTGARLWQDSVAGAWYATLGMVLDGRLYVMSQPTSALGGDAATVGGAVTAFDAATGVTLWTAPSVAGFWMATDGTVLVTEGTDATSPAGAEAGSTVESQDVDAVQAYALDDGRPMWRDDLRDAVSADGTDAGLGGLDFFLPVPHVGAMSGTDGSLTVLG